MYDLAQAIKNQKTFRKKHNTVIKNEVNRETKTYKISHIAQSLNSSP